MITSMIFFPEKAFYEMPKDYQFEYDNVFIQTSDHVKLHGWYLKAREEKAAILFLHGNAGNISHRLFKAKGWIDRGISVFLIDYRGYGQSQGEIKHGNDLLLDAEAAFKYLTEIKGISLKKIILYGESVGSYPAIRLGCDHKIAALILEAPFTSFKELARIHYSMMPGFLTEALLKDFEFSNIANIPNVKTPVFILQGDQDEICPCKMGKELFEKATPPKDIFTIPGGHHNDLPMLAGGDYWQKPYEFINQVQQ